MQQQQGNIMGMVFPIILFIGIFYFLILRPQKKKQKQHDAMLSSISRGDTVVTAGGFFGVVRDVLDDSFLIEVADGVKMRILKSSVSVKRETGAGNGSAAKPLRKKKRPRPEHREGDDSVSHAESAALNGKSEDTPAEEPQTPAEPEVVEAHEAPVEGETQGAEKEEERRD